MLFRNAPQPLASPRLDQFETRPLADAHGSLSGQLDKLTAAFDQLATQVRESNAREAARGDRLAALEQLGAVTHGRLDMLEQRSHATQQELSRMAAGLQSQQAEQLRTFDILSESLEQLLPAPEGDAEGDSRSKPPEGRNDGSRWRPRDERDPSRSAQPGPDAAILQAPGAAARESVPGASPL